MNNIASGKGSACKEGKQMAEKEPLTKQDLMDALKQVIPPIIDKLNTLEKKIDNKPDRDEVRQIVREELDTALERETFTLTRKKG
jgi:hypothetical protein